MTQQSVRISVLVSATADLTVGAWIVRRAGRLGTGDVDFIDLATAPLPDRRTAMLPAEGGQPAVVDDLVPWLMDADGFVVILSGGAEGVPRQVRNALDWCTSAWAGKPVALVTSGHAHPDPPVPPDVRSAFHSRRATLIGSVGVGGDPLGHGEHRLSDQNSRADRLLAELMTAAGRVRAAAAV